MQQTCGLTRQRGQLCLTEYATCSYLSTTSARRVQVLKTNVASLTHVIVPVHAALVDTATAEEQKTLTLKGRGSEYWGFRVDHNGRKQEDTVTYEVETRTLAQIQVCYMFVLWQSWCARGRTRLHTRSSVRYR